MAENNERHYRHIVLDGIIRASSYTSPGSARSGRKIKERNRNTHGRRVLNKLIDVKKLANRLKAKDYQNLHRDDGTYIEFTSPIDFDIEADSLDLERSGIELLNVRPQKLGPENDHIVYKATVYVPENKIDIFIRKVERYLTENSKYKGEDTGNPKHQKFVNSIEDIRLATLKSFWTDFGIDFPDLDESIWWEVWFRKNNSKVELSTGERILKQVELAELSISDRKIEFPEHTIYLIQGSANDLSKSVLLLNSLAEIRKAKTRASFFTEFLGQNELDDWVEEAQQRIDLNEGTTTICLLDSGVNNGHPLLNQVLQNNRMDSIEPAWGNGDSYGGGGHGTLMAGIATLGDLTPYLADTSSIQLLHDLESVKIFNPADPNDPDLYGNITEEACSRAITLDPDKKRIYCMAVTTTDNRDEGRPSSWSATIDKILYLDSENSNSSLFCIAGGNVIIENPDDYPTKNLTDEIHDPGQSWNALTVGTYTERDSFSEEEFPDYELIAPKGQMGPSNSTSITWDNNWPYKPDLVLEGGNMATNGINCDYLDDLQLLSTRKDFRINPIGTFGDTSAASAEASRYAAIITSEYDRFWPETVRGLMIHSSNWTDEMLNNRNLEDLNKSDLAEIIRMVGYGVPDLNRALYSANNSLTLIAQEEIMPFKKVGYEIKTDEIHIYDLPWPTEVLEQLGATEVTLNVTLSYFIEPNPGQRNYSSKYYYQSHGLRFDVKRAAESTEEFFERINKEARNDDYDGTETSTENWQVGSRGRTRGSVHRDFWFGTAADLATKNQILVYPVTGWWRSRKPLERYENRSRYSLIVSIYTPPIDVDIYNPVANQIAITT